MDLRLNQHRIMSMTPGVPRIGAVLGSTSGARLVEHTSNDRYWGTAVTVAAPTDGYPTRASPVGVPPWPTRRSEAGFLAGRR